MENAEETPPARYRHRTVWISGIKADKDLWLYNKTDNDHPTKCPGMHKEKRPRYFKILAGATKDYFDGDYGQDLYLSLSELIELETSDQNRTEVIGVANTPSWTKREADFVDKECQTWTITHTTDYATRARTGNERQTVAVIIPSAKLNKWKTLVQKAFGVSSGGSFKPSRQCTIRLDKPLIITPVVARRREDLINGRFSMTTAQFLSAAVAEANLAASEDKNVWELKFQDGDTDPENYIQISVDPFNFYRSWIHQKDWDKYMKSLVKPPQSAIRHFISLAEQESREALDELLVTVGERDIAIQSLLKPADYVAMGLDPQQRPQDQQAAARFNRKVNAALKRKRLQGIGAFQKSNYFNNGRTDIHITLDVPKMNLASGKRAKELSQKSVMGGFSASDIAKTLDWEATRMGSGFFPSEWLHLAAFSWGGYLPSDHRTGFSTSQNLENLIFGTSETNSLMTRYEMAWQSFFRLEQELFDKLCDNKQGKTLSKDKRNLSGSLQITCNDFTKPIRMDIHDNGRYDIGYITLDADLVQHATQIADANMESDEPQLNCDLFPTFPELGNDRYTFGQEIDNNNQSISQTDMLAIAFDFPFVVYTMKYSVSGRFRSILLDEPQPGASFYFYPFQRTLYHQAEAALDAVIWRELKAAAWRHVDQRIESGIFLNAEIIEAERHAKRGTQTKDQFHHVLANRDAISRGEVPLFKIIRNDPVRADPVRAFS